ncbi:MAG: hypothetical protein DI636_07965 [Pelagerythrobacter marensis]|nr:MAG: hypothetical protein DI636_07965 [Pelagerythrobacter marensis]
MRDLSDKGTEISWKSISEASTKLTGDGRPLSRSLLYLPHYRAIWDDDKVGGSLQDKSALIRRLRAEVRSLKAENGKLRARLDSRDAKLAKADAKAEDLSSRLETAEARIQDLLLGYVVKT